MKKLQLCSLSLLWMASWLNADEVASEEEPYAPYKGKYTLRSDESADNEDGSEDEAPEREHYVAYKGKYALRGDESAANNSCSEDASEEKPYVPYKGKYTLRSDESADNEDGSEDEAPERERYVAYKGKYAFRPEKKNKPVSKEQKHYVFLEEKASYFSPISKKIRDIYAKGMGLYGFELTFPAWRFIYGWAGGSYLSKVGHTSFAHSRTKVQLVPLGIGLKFVYTVDCVDLYAGVGGLGTYFHTNDQSQFVIRSTSKWAAGGIGKLGLFIRPTHGFFIDIFGDYSYMKFNFHGGSKKVMRHNVDFSGWSVGGGIGWTF